MRSKQAEPYQAIFFIDDHRVKRQMRFSEFEALLRGLATIQDLADTEVQAVYAEINPKGFIEALVFFLIYFDDDGYADPDWSLPVENLAAKSGKGPDLGGGPIKLACRSQCSINWHQKELWDPDMNPGTNDFIALRKAVEENRLGLVFQEDETVPTLEPAGIGNTGPEKVREGLDGQKRLKLAQLIKQQRLRIRTLESHLENSAENAHREQRLEAQAYKNELQEMKLTLQQYKVQTDKLKDKLFARNEQLLQLQDQVSGQSQHLNELQDKLKTEKPDAQAQQVIKKLESELVILKEQLGRRDIELAYRDEKEEQLRLELEELKESMSTPNVAESSILETLREREVVFVAYHPGVGHVTMTYGEIADYAANPMAFVAAKCFVTEEHYKSWLEHYEAPVCNHMSPSGNVCGQALPKIETPSEFEPGINDRCTVHQVSGIS